MKMLSFFGLIICILLNLGKADAQNKLAVPKDWKQIRACGISFYAPPDLKPEKKQGIDSCVKSYVSKDILIYLDKLGNYKLKETASRESSYSGEKDFHLEKTQTDGRKSEIILYYKDYFKDEGIDEWRDFNYGAVLFVPLISQDNGGNLTVWAYSRSAKGQDISKQVFETVRFSK